MSIHYRYQHHHHHHRHHQHGMDTPKISETLKTQATTALKLIKTVVEFSQKLASIYDQHANSLRTASDTFRKKTNDVLTKENREDEAPALLGSIWKTILQDTENEAEANSALAKAFTEYLVIPLQDCGNQQKQIIKKLTNYQEEFEDKMTKTKESLTKCQKEYHDNWTKAKSKDPANKSSAMLSCYHAHNEYLLQLTAINHFLKKYYLLVLPEILSSCFEISGQGDVLTFQCRPAQLWKPVLATSLFDGNDHDEFHIQLAKSVAQCLSLALRTGKNKVLPD
uniref:SLIT-ROBO Rho GTPase-activating protein 3-like n=1 Tax=Saccoglossus kowalevskii TaxID=10224 RepID=A0ABM0MD02_SACKO|nr:PREDICTED: SLIT-ROBO Rho GTPase-activating protein 3-like [Saccoglossus kowalevskii]